MLWQRRFELATTSRFGVRLRLAGPFLPLRSVSESEEIHGIPSQTAGSSAGTTARRFRYKSTLRRRLCSSQTNSLPERPVANSERRSTNSTRMLLSMRHSVQIAVNVGATRKRTATGFVESAVNQIISKRFAKKQQMQWTKKGAHLVLQMRTQGERQEVGGQVRPGRVCNPVCALRFRVNALHDVVCCWWAPPTF
jgi:hypothetical protein